MKTIEAVATTSGLRAAVCALLADAGRRQAMSFVVDLGL